MILLLVQVLLILLNAIFACAEIAVISMNGNKLAKYEKQGDKRAIRLMKLTSEPAKFLATIQVAITLSGFLGSAFAADNFSDKLVRLFIRLGVHIPYETLDTLSVILITLILSYFTLIFGELVPKRIAMRKAEKLALMMSGPITGISKIFAPIVWTLTISTNGILRLIGINPNEQDNKVSEEEIRMLVEEGSKNGIIEEDENNIIQNVFEFDDMTVGELATHRTEVTMLWMGESIEKWNDVIKNSKHRFYPVCNESVDKIIGILDTKIYFRMEEISKENAVEKAVLPAYFIPESIKADILFRNMKKKKHHFAIVLDEYGGMVGIVTMNDLIEEILGDFTDDSEENYVPDIVEIDSETWKIHGSTQLEDINQTLNINLPTDEYDTFNGLVFGTLGDFPEDKSNIHLNVENLDIQIIHMKEHMIESAIVRIK